MQGTAERACRKRQPLGRDRGEQRGGASRARGKALEQIQTEERRCESGRGRTNRRSPSDGVDTKSDPNLRLLLAKSGSETPHVISPGEREYLDDLLELVAPRPIDRDVAQQENRPCGGVRVESGRSDIAGLARARERRRESTPRIDPQSPREIAQPLVDPIGFGHRAQQRRVGSRENTSDLRREIVRAVCRERIERANPELMLFVHQEPHQVRLVGKLVVEGSDPDTCGLADLVDAGPVADLTKRDPRCRQKTCALFLRAPLPPPTSRSIGQAQNVSRLTSPHNLRVVPFICRGHLLRSGAIVMGCRL